MKANGQKAKMPKQNGKNSRLKEFLCDNDCGLYVEEYFQDLLCLERKRAERSKKSFLLVLLNIENALRRNATSAVVKDIVSVLFTCTRETDIKGWYSYNSLIGIILTETSELDKAIFEDKLYHHLRSTLGTDVASDIGVAFHVFPDNDKDHSEGIRPDFTFYPDIPKRECDQRASLTVKRCIDIIGSIVAILILSPLFLLIPILIKLSSNGPVLFRQQRVGYCGKNFSFLKFRSMYIDNDPKIHQEYIRQFICEQKSYDKNGGKENCVFKIKDDPRITPLGKFLRKTSLDELPQFFNALMGDMSLVGPRPPIPYELTNYDAWHLNRVLTVKPGITGLWQVAGRSRTTFNEMVRMDLKYIREWSVWLDIKIIVQTPWVVLFGKGAY